MNITIAKNLGAAPRVGGGAGSWCRMLPVLCPENIPGLEVGPCHRPLMAAEPPENAWSPALSLQLQQHWCA